MQLTASKNFRNISNNPNLQPSNRPGRGANQITIDPESLEETDDDLTPRGTKRPGGAATDNNSNKVFIPVCICCDVIFNYIVVCQNKFK
jgi:hypothetical protein